MGNEIKARELLGKPVLAVAEGKQLGSINSILVRPGDYTVTVVGVGGGLMSHTYHLPFSRLKSIGTAAATVENEAALQQEPPKQEIQRLDSSLPGRSVVTEGGERLGQIQDFSIDTTTGQILGYYVSCDPGFLARLKSLGKDQTMGLPQSLVVSLGVDALVVRNEAASLLHTPAAGA